MKTQTESGSGADFESLRDFPEWLSPMLVKEFRQGLRSGSFVALLVALHLGVVLVEAFGLAASVRSESTRFVGTLFLGAVYAVLLLGAPLRALAGLHAERESRTLELLGAAGVSGTRLAWGKWISLMTQSALMVVSLLPYFVLRYYTGGVDLGLDGRLFVLSCLGSGVCVAAALAASGLQRAGVRAFAGAFFCLVFLLSWVASSVLLDDSGAVAALNMMGRGWLLIGATAVWCVVVLLRLAGDAVGTASENGALWPRLLLLPAWAVAFVPWLRGVEEQVYLGYLWALAGLSLAVFSWHVGASCVFEAHLRGFKRFGVFGFWGAIFLLPNWVGCLWVLPLAVGAFVLTVKSVVNQTIVLLVGACLASGVLLLRVFFQKARNPLWVFALHGGLGCLASAISSALTVSWNSKWLSFFPTIGLWRYLSVQSHSLRDSTVLPEWRQSAQAAFLAYLFACGIPALIWAYRELRPRWKTR